MAAAPRAREEVGDTGGGPGASEAVEHASQELQGVVRLKFQGAEARLYTGELGGRPVFIKERFVKTYRHPDIDTRLRMSRMASEAKMLVRARRAGLRVPSVYFADTMNARLYCEFIPGPTVKEYFQRTGGEDRDKDAEEKVSSVLAVIGRMLARLHDLGITHGDLTTSNMIAANGEPHAVVLLDFGLSQSTTAAIDKAVDLYVCERAFLSTHGSMSACFPKLLEEYRASSEQGSTVMAYLAKVRARGRKKLCFG